MFRLSIALMFVLSIALTACEQEQVAETPNVEDTTTAEEGIVETEEQEGALGEGEAPAVAMGEQDETALGQEDVVERETAMGEPAAEGEQQVATEEPAGQQEYMGQSPEFGDAPETITLEAKNGNVEFSHKTHADMMDCQTCHGAGEPGPIEGWSKDKAHDLCKGCHQEKGAGPTKCSECHKK